MSSGKQSICLPCVLLGALKQAGKSHAIFPQYFPFANSYQTVTVYTSTLLDEVEILVHFAMVVFLRRSELRAKWSESPSRVPVITSTHVLRAAKSELW